nr:putative ribonuclease H-like domain-containing protein [Tanacetum cinerariifolium]
KYLTAYPKLGLWYPRDSPFDLEAFSDNDYAGAHGDKKSTTGGCQWSLVTSAGRVIFCWLIVIPAGDLVPAGHKSFLLVVSFSCWYALTANPTINASLVRQFWGSASKVSIPDGVKGLEATIDGTSYTINEASIRSALQLDDLNAVDRLTNAEIFDGLRAIGNIAIALICLSTGRKYNVSNMIFNGEPAVVQAQPQEVSPPPPSLVVEPHPLTDPMPSPPRQSSPLQVSPPPPSPVVEPHPLTDPMPSPPRQSSPLLLQTITSPIRDDDTGGGSFHESPPSPPPATPTRTTFEAELKATKILHRDAVVLFAKRIKKLESKLKNKKRKLMLSDLENEEEAR